MEVPGESVFSSRVWIFFTNLPTASACHALLFTGAWFGMRKMDLFGLDDVGDGLSSIPNMLHWHPHRRQPPEPGTAGGWVPRQGLHSADLDLLGNVAIVLTASSGSARGCRASGLQLEHKTSVL